MPDLEVRIGGWKRSLTIVFGGSAEIVAELESHLREEIDRLTQAGQEPDTAFECARAKLGRPSDLAAEYIARVAAPKGWLPIPIGLVLFVLPFGFVSCVFILPKLLAGGDAVLAAHVAALVAGYAAAFYAGLLGMCYVACWLVRPIGLGQRRALGRALVLANTSAAILLAGGVLLGMVWAENQWGRAWNNDPAEIGTSIAILWFAVMAGLIGLAPGRQHLWMLLAILGICVGIWGWVGPAWFKQLHAYGTNESFLFWLLTGGTAVPLAVALLGIFPPGRLTRQPA